MSYASVSRSRVGAYLLLAASMALSAPRSSAAPQLWSQQPGTATFDRFTALVDDGASGVYCVGSTAGSLFGTGLGNYDAVLAHYDAMGQLVMGKQLGSSGSESAGGVALDGAGGLFVAGGSAGDFGGAGFPGVFVARVDGTGDLVWAEKVPDYGYFSIAGVVADGAGGCIVVFETTPNGLVDQDVDVFRMDAAGNFLWYVSLGTGTYDTATFAKADGQGGVILGGATAGAMGGPSSGSQDAWYANLDASGNILWMRQFGTPSQDHLGDVALDGSGGLILAGDTWGSMVSGAQFGQADLYLARVDGSGNFLWTQQHGSTGRDEGYALAVDPTGKIFVAGSTDGNFGAIFSGKLADIWVGRFASDGTQPVIFQKGFHDYDSADALLATRTGGVFALGSVSGPLFEPGSHHGVSDAWVARFQACDFDFLGPTNFCVASPNSTGQAASISSEGSGYVPKNDYVLTAAGCPANQLGIFVMGTGQASTPFGNGVLCVGGGVLRLLPPVSTGASGSCALALDFTHASSSASQIDAGETWNFQFWFRDVAAGGAGFNLSNGLSATFCP